MLMAFSQSSLWGFFKSGLTVLNTLASATVIAPVRSGRVLSISSLYSSFNGGNLANFHRQLLNYY